jgi:hypothetical protein
MKYLEIVTAFDQSRRDNNIRIRDQAPVRQIGQSLIEAPINRLYNELMDALEGRLMNLAGAEPIRRSPRK